MSNLTFAPQLFISSAADDWSRWSVPDEWWRNPLSQRCGQAVKQTDQLLDKYSDTLAPLDTNLICSIRQIASDGPLGRN